MPREIKEILNLMKKLGMGDVHVERNCGKVIKEFPATPKQVKEYEAIEILSKEAERMENEVDARRRKFWSETELALGEYGHLHWNGEKKTIELIDTSEKSERPIISPIQINRDEK